MCVCVYVRTCFYMEALGGGRGGQGRVWPQTCPHPRLVCPAKREQLHRLLPEDGFYLKTMKKWLLPENHVINSFYLKATNGVYLKTMARIWP